MKFRTRPVAIAGDVCGAGLTLEIEENAGMYPKITAHVNAHLPPPRLRSTGCSRRFPLKPEDYERTRTAILCRARSTDVLAAVI